MNRIDLYAQVHKGVRAALFEAALRIARTDFERPDEAAAAAGAARQLVTHLERHAAHEDAEVMPELARVSPEVHADLAADHARTDGLQREVVALADRIGTAAKGAERASLGRKLHDLLGRLVAEHLRHMEREEGPAMRALWAHRTDAELEAIHGRILARIPPAELAAWGAVLLPALSLPERTAILRPLVERVPRPALEALLAPTRAAMGPRWDETAAAVGL